MSSKHPKQPQHKGKINRHERVAQVLLTGLPVSKADLEKVFENDPQAEVLYRLSTNIYNIRKDGGVVKVHKKGREVTGYQLVNIDEFNEHGRYIGKNARKETQEVAKDTVAA
jgi:hypothetical protein